MFSNTKKILIESEALETFRLRIVSPRILRLYCDQCRTADDMLDINSAADISGITARELVVAIETGVLHAPYSPNGHLLLCRGSLEAAISAGELLQRASDEER